jgi:hypothetical protein
MVGHSVNVNSSSFLLIKREKIVEEMSCSKNYFKKSSVGSKSSSDLSECFVEPFKSDSNDISPKGSFARFSRFEDIVNIF